MTEIEHHHRTRMLRDIGVHRVEETDIIDTLSSVRKDLAHPFAALAVLLEGKRRGQEPVLRIAQSLLIDRVRTLSCMSSDGGFVVEGIDL